MQEQQNGLSETYGNKKLEKSKPIQKSGIDISAILKKADKAIAVSEKEDKKKRIIDLINQNMAQVSAGENQTDSCTCF